MDRQIILAQHAPSSSLERLSHLATAAASARRQVSVGCVLAYAEFDSERIFCRELFYANSVIRAIRRPDWRNFQAPKTGDFSVDDGIRRLLTHLVIVQNVMRGSRIRA